jgi:ribosomal protein S18 acetylase RimI-like enzyme
MAHFLQLGSLTCGSLHRRAGQTDEDLLQRFTSFAKEFAFEPQSEIWVAETAEGVYAGHLWLHESVNRFNGVEEMWIWDISVVPDFRRRGIGETLMEFAKRRASEKRCTELWLLVAEDNEPARALYDSSGLGDCARMMKIRLGFGEL